MRIGILGGTFNPIHLAHLRIAEEVREACSLDRVLFIPAADPPHKPVAEEVPFAQRLAMVEAAIAENPAFAASDLESHRTGKSYSVHTLEILRRDQPDQELFFIIGMDSFRDIGSWREYRRLFPLAHIVVAARPGISSDDPQALLPVAIRGDFCYDVQSKTLLHRSGNRVIFLEETLLDISSTRIRRLAADGRSIRYLVTPAVEEYVSTHGLYRDQKRF
ncbi:nicotinate-nucleotide adenylyltransferase [Desulfuromonas sp. TF]|jgi:nicotinate-nucleotide adenylyltransferase|uniref:nicotinate-nucleotide adenylyltransferase n=1 Tax=Desulfuromonas sp. TF TaxID=1232410 RepID=UPI00040AE0D8|nr:nicotinate-nucleotide adenylyltransferase [Desulfuromonas sp. TF]